MISEKSVFSPFDPFYSQGTLSSENADSPITQWVEEIGFEDVVELNFYMPTNPWAKGKYFKQVGALLEENYIKGIEGMSLRVIGALGWTAEEIRAFLVRVKRDIQDPSITCYVPM
jgi:hypothetical protein